MNKQELSKQVAQTTGQSVAAVPDVLEAALDEIGSTLADGDSVALTGFGTFQPRPRAARRGMNPQTGEALDIPATTVAGFKAASALKRRLTN